MKKILLIALPLMFACGGADKDDTAAEDTAAAEAAEEGTEEGTEEGAEESE